MTPDGAELRPVFPRSRAVAVGLNEQWFVMPETGERQGPYSAAQIARLLEQGLIGWNSQIWREGLKDWRPARRDDLLVFAVASARGMASDTSRVDMLAEILQDDTFIQDEPPALPRKPEHVAPLEPAAVVHLREPSVPREPAVPPPPPPRPEAPITAPSSAAPPKRPSWLLRYSTPLIAVLAFASGVLLTQVWRRLGGVPSEQDTGTPRARTDDPAGRAPLVRAAAVPAPREPSASAVAAAPKVSLRAQPETREVEAEFERLAPSVRRCARRLGSLDVEVVLEGSTGRARPTQLRAKGLRGAKLGCVASVLGGLRVAPFAAPAFRLAHRYRW